jgi:DNA-binding transcriptional MerR regulator
MVAMSEVVYDIGELAALSGLTVRTIRYYIQQKLVPPSPSMGPGAGYGNRHLTRLRLIRHFQRKQLSLAEIRQKLEAADLVGDPSRDSSAEYLEAILAASSEAGSDDSPTTSSSAGQLLAVIASRSQWERITVTGDVEIHVRRPLTRMDNRNLERLVEAAKEMFGEDSSVLKLVSPTRTGA